MVTNLAPVWRWIWVLTCVIGVADHARWAGSHEHRTPDGELGVLVRLLNLSESGTDLSGASEINTRIDVRKRRLHRGPVERGGEHKRAGKGS
jgi:hypothetical protein